MMDTALDPVSAGASRALAGCYVVPYKATNVVSPPMNGWNQDMNLRPYGRQLFHWAVRFLTAQVRMAGTGGHPP